MILGVYCIKDVKTSFWRPHTQVNDVAAIREFDNMINSRSNAFVNDNYADLELWKCGTYDDVTGNISPCLEFIVKGIDVRKVVEKDA